MVRSLGTHPLDPWRAAARAAGDEVRQELGLVGRARATLYPAHLEAARKRVRATAEDVSRPGGPSAAKTPEEKWAVYQATREAAEAWTPELDESSARGILGLAQPLTHGYASTILFAGAGAALAARLGVHGAGGAVLQAGAAAIAAPLGLVYGLVGGAGVGLQLLVGATPDENAGVFPAALLP